MGRLESKMAYFRNELAELNMRTKGEVRELVEGSPFKLTRDEVEEVIRSLEEAFDIEQPRGASVKSEFHPWLDQRKAQKGIDFYYWERLKRYYLQRNVLPPQVVATLDSVTDEVLDYSGNPLDEAPWRRRGMVMGHVQSGKTTNYASLICKAADAGYKIVILLAGITNSLRRQTQERLDETFVGKKSLFHRAAQETLSIVNFADLKRFPAYGTSRDRDFSKAAAATYGVSLSALKEPIIFVTKKNKATLESLRDWLREQNHGRKIHDALLMVDDEADNASINTSSNSDRVTAINRVIREILELFSRSTYIGYTATPFANIFIDPDTEDEMIGDDLFPRHFIKALDPPSNYVGATRMFKEDGDLRVGMLKWIEDYADFLPLRHKKDLDLFELPPSLCEAIRVFVLSRAIRVLRDAGDRHCSMMVNVSRFNDVQERVYGLIYAYLEQLRNSLIVNAGRGDRAMTDPLIRQIAEDFLREYSDVGFEWPDVLDVLVEAVSTVRVKTINMRGGELEYAQYADQGLHVIAVGGLALSRGLTLEGLTVSYILRNASASDTLMQMARWFGYRMGYEEICRLYLPEESSNHYEFITEATEELRSEIKRMQAADMTPEDFGLRVRHSPAAIRITAANKMRNAQKLTLAQDYSGRHVEGYALANDSQVNARNRDRVKALTGDIGVSEYVDDGDYRIWRGVPAPAVFQLITEFEFPSEAHPDLGPIMNGKSLFADYVSDRLGDECAEWDVALPLSSNRGKSNSDLLEGTEIKIRERTHGRLKGDIYIVTDKNKVAGPGDDRIGLISAQMVEAESLVDEGAARNRAYARVRSRPMLMLHVFEASLRNGAPGLECGNPVVSLSFCMPTTDVPIKERQYQVNPVYLKQLREFDDDSDDDEHLLDGDVDG